MLKNFKMRDYESGYIFEQKIIYDLKTENERLKAMMGGRTQPPPEQSHNYIQKRLSDFNRKL